MRHGILFSSLLVLLFGAAGGVFVLLNQGAEPAREALVAGVSAPGEGEKEQEESGAGTLKEQEQAEVLEEEVFEAKLSAEPQTSSLPAAAPTPEPQPEPEREQEPEPEPEPEESPQPLPPPPPPPTPAVKQYEGCLAGQINVNSALKEKLEEITRVGEVRADQIITLRQQEPFWSIEDLARVSGIGATTVQNIKTEGFACAADPSIIPDSSAQTAPPPPESSPPPPPPESEACQEGQVNVNTASLEEIVEAEIYQIGPSRAEQLVALRPFASLQDLTRVPGISDGRAQEIIAQGIACVK